MQNLSRNDTIYSMNLRRHSKKKVDLFLSIFPVVLLTGARQTGKTTLVEEIAKERGYFFCTLDDISFLRAAKEDPQGFIGNLPKPVILDEIQRAPELFLPIKQWVDRHKEAGQFLVTGSANPLLLPHMEDSLAGRMGVVFLYPLSQGEIEGKKETFLLRLFGEGFLGQKSFARDSLLERIRVGGFPKVREQKTLQAQEIWIENYLRAMMERDVRDLANIVGSVHFFELFRLMANRSGSLFNGADIGRSLQLSTATVHRYVRLLEALFFLYFSPAWLPNRNSRAAKSPKVYVGDTAILLHLLGLSLEEILADKNRWGFVFESFVVGELQKQVSWQEESFSLSHFRNQTKEVDIVLENRKGRVVGIEVKSRETVHPKDFAGLRMLKDFAGEKFVQGVVLYGGEEVLPFGEHFWAVPIASLWG